MLKSNLKKSERGQAIILIAFAIVGLIAMVGLMIDGGILFIEYARLKRGIDAAAVAAALSFRESATEQELVDAATEFLQLNQSDVFDVWVDICERLPNGEPDPTQISPDPEVQFPIDDPALCTAVPRKLVRVTATRHVQFGFLSVIGRYGTNVSATSIGEAAALDLVLVIDTSQSMSNETDPSGSPNTADPGDDPFLCNATFTCEPLESVKNVAADFVNSALYFPYDRVAIVTSTQQVVNGTRDPFTVLELTSNKATVLDALGQLRVFQPRECSGDGVTPGTCRNMGGGVYNGMSCDYCVANNDYSTYPSSDLGDALWQAGARFGVDPATTREESLWVVIMLAGGPANASNPDPDNLPGGFCPEKTQTEIPYCRDNEWPARPSGSPGPNTRHCYTSVPPQPPWQFHDSCIAAGGIDNSALYDADDYAHDWADWVAGAPSDTDPTDEDGQGAIIFTIGLGNFVRNTSVGDPDDGEELLMYIAEQAGDNLSPGVILNHGFYSYAPSTAQLGDIFRRIADNVATRISQ